LPQVEEEVDMLSLYRRLQYGLALLAAGFTATAFAAPAGSHLLRVVPAGAEIVSGIAAPGTPGANGQILAVTESNNRDFDDCLALLGVDGDKAIEEVIEAASSSEAGDLTEHLLLLYGRFNPGAIFKSALENGAARSDPFGSGLLAIPPMRREQHETGTRWLAIPDDRVLVFGTPGIVASALDRYAHSEQPDPILLRRLAQLGSDVNSWSVLAMPPPMLEAHLALYPLPQSWKTALRHADELAVGIHYGRYDRVDFAFHTSGSGDSLGRLPAEGQLIPASLTSVRRFRIEREPADRNRICGSIAVRAKELDSWLESAEQSRSAAQWPARERRGLQ
jgi:hypothetical protein